MLPGEVRRESGACSLSRVASHALHPTVLKTRAQLVRMGEKQRLMLMQTLFEVYVASGTGHHVLGLDLLGISL